MRPTPLFRILAQDHSACQAGIAAGGIPALVDLLGDEPVQQTVLGVLASLAGNTDVAAAVGVRSAMAEGGAIEALEHLACTAQSQLVRDQAQAVLISLDAVGAPEPDAAAAGVPEADAGEVLRQLAAADDPEPRNQALTKLAGLCANPAIAAAVVEAGGLQQLVQLAKKKNRDTRQWVAPCLRRIAAVQELNAPAVAAGAIPALVALLSRKSAAEDAAWALW